MPAEPLILSGKPVAKSLKQELQTRVTRLAERGVQPGLAAVLVGENPASQVYVASKERQARKLGLKSVVYKLPADTSQAQVLQLIEELNRDSSIHGILVQLPLPAQLDSDIILNSVDPDKDVDGFHPWNMGLLALGKPAFVPCTPAGILAILKHYGISTVGKHVVILGRSRIVGTPLALLLSRKSEHGNATVTICHSVTTDLAYHTRQADILIAAIGKPHMITAEMVKEGVVVVDVGINRVPDSEQEKGYRLVGDVNFAAVAPKTTAITPVPGGVGPMTITMLLANTITAAERLSGY